MVTLERPIDQPFGLDEIEPLRLACDLATARLVNLRAGDRWLGARAADSIRKFFAEFLGPTHTLAKMAAIAGFLLIMFLVFAKGEYRVEAPFVLEAVTRHVMPAPFDGYIKTVNVDLADEVKAGQVLATLDTAELRAERAIAMAERLGHLKAAAVATRDASYQRDPRKTAEAQIAKAKADQASARVVLLDYRIQRAQITSPIDGVVVVGDLRPKVGSRCRVGEVLFEVAPLESLRAELAVPEAAISDVLAAMARARLEGTEVTGELATASAPGQRLEFVVERINPVAEVIKQQNVFRVRVRLAETEMLMRPGLEGLAKISVGRRRYAWIWTHRLTDWARMKLWL